MAPKKDEPVRKSKRQIERKIRRGEDVPEEDLLCFEDDYHPGRQRAGDRQTQSSQRHLSDHPNSLQDHGCDQDEVIGSGLHQVHPHRSGHLTSPDNSHITQHSRHSQPVHRESQHGSDNRQRLDQRNSLDHCTRERGGQHPLPDGQRDGTQEWVDGARGLAGREPRSYLQPTSRATHHGVTAGGEERPKLTSKKYLTPNWFGFGGRDHQRKRIPDRLQLTLTYPMEWESFVERIYDVILNIERAREHALQSYEDIYERKCSLTEKAIIWMKALPRDTQKYKAQLKKLVRDNRHLYDDLIKEGWAHTLLVKIREDMEELFMVGVEMREDVMREGYINSIDIKSCSSAEAQYLRKARELKEKQRRQEKPRRRQESSKSSEVDDLLLGSPYQDPTPPLTPQNLQANEDTTNTSRYHKGLKN
jgi:hypothetical protein